MQIVRAGRVGEVKPRETVSCVVYDPRDGRVAHLHQVVVVGEGRMPAREEVEATALAAASRRGDVSNMRVLHTPPGTVITPGAALKVDLSDNSLRQEPAPERRPGTSSSKRTPLGLIFLVALLGGALGALIVFLILRAA